MDYFTFLGTGGYNGYSEIAYLYGDDFLTTKYVQQLVLKSFKDSINRVIVFCTEKSKTINGDGLKEALLMEKQDVNVEYRIVEEEIPSSEFIHELIDNISDPEIIIDITHMFRHIPMRLMFMINYIEKSRNIRIEHLFYGKKRFSTDEGELIDLIHDYRMHELAEALNLFDMTLYLSPETIEKHIARDKNIERLLKAMSNLNVCMETSNYKDTIFWSKKIIEACSSISKMPDMYEIILPFIHSIKTKFSIVQEANSFKAGSGLIRVLLRNQKLQTAITFADYLFRISLIKKSTKDADRIIEGTYSNNCFYMCSQELINGRNGYHCRYHINDYIYYDGLDYGITLNPKLTSYLAENSKVENFYGNIRNSVNHGSRTDKDEAERATYDLLDIIEEMEVIIRR